MNEPIDHLVIGATNTLRNWRMRLEYRGRPVESSDAMRRIDEMGLDLDHATKQRIIDQVLGESILAGMDSERPPMASLAPWPGPHQYSTLPGTDMKKVRKPKKIV